MAQRRTERWTTRLGVILAVAGSAIGLGNFLRFPTQVAQYGGGAFMIPYFVALLLLGLPLMWMEWALGRLGGAWGHHTLPGIFDAVIRRRWGKYLGVLGLYIPFLIVVYYMYIESWTLGYTFLSASGEFARHATPEQMAALLNQQYLGAYDGAACSWSGLALTFLLATLAINFWVVYRGIAAGIEKLNRFAMPALFVLAIILMVRVLTLPTAQASPFAGLNFFWTPDFTALKNPQVWLAAAGQIFFTLSLGLGAIITYASYLRKDDDVALSGLTSASLNETAEVILGGTIAIPAAVVFFGTAATMVFAQGGSFSLGFLAMPMVFHQMPGGMVFGAMWFLLLFFAGITSSVSLLQPILAFFQDELGWTRKKGAVVLFALTALYLVPLVLFTGHGFIDDLDFWAVNVLLPLGALVEVIIFAWVLGMKSGWEAITAGARLRVPIIFKFILQYITPLFLIVLLVAWVRDGAWKTLTLDGVKDADKPYLIAGRVIMGVVLLAMLLMLRYAWQHKLDQPEEIAPQLEAAEAAVDAPGSIIDDFTPELFANSAECDPADDDTTKV
jgi:NSS family neurotransmitter:Na+ symporter